MVQPYNSIKTTNQNNLPRKELQGPTCQSCIKWGTNSEKKTYPNYPICLFTNPYKGF